MKYFGEREKISKIINSYSSYPIQNGSYPIIFGIFYYIDSLKTFSKMINEIFILEKYTDKQIKKSWDLVSIDDYTIISRKRINIHYLTEKLYLYDYNKQLNLLKSRLKLI